MIGALFLSLTCVFAYKIETEASNTKNININKMSYSEVNELVSELLMALANNDINTVTKLEPYMNDVVYNGMLNNCGKSIRGNISDIVIDVVEPKDSSSGDTVLLANVKAWASNQTYNTICLFEFHVNSDGKLYGYNIWAY